MRKQIFTLLAFLISISLFAQEPKGIKYQAVARDNAGQLLTNKNIALKISIVSGSENGVTNYAEVHRVTTNEYGLFNIKIGNGDLLSGNYNNITWGNASHFIRVEIDPNGDNNFTFLGVSELLAVPYSWHAETVTNADDADADPTNEIQVLTRNGYDIKLSNNGGTISIDDADADPANEIQTISQNGNVITLSNGGGSITLVEQDGSVSNEIQDLVFDSGYLTITNNPSANVIDLNQLFIDADDQELAFDSLTGILYLEDGGVVDLSVLINDNDADAANEIQTISRTGNDLELSHGGGLISIEDADADATNELQVLSQNGPMVDLSNGGGSININDDDHNPMNEIQDLYQVGDSIILTNNPSATIIDLSPYKDNTDAQTLSIAGTDLTIADGNTIDLSSLINDADADTTNELQTISQVGTVVTLSNGGGTISIADNDDDAGNELITSAVLAGNTLEIADAGGTSTIDLSSLINDADADTTNELQTISQVGTNVTLSNGGGTISVADNDNDAANELITSVALTGNTLEIVDAGGTSTIDLSSLINDADADATNEIQDLQLAGNDLSITNNGSASVIDLSPYFDNTDAQSLTLDETADSLFIAGGNGIDMDKYSQNLSAQVLPNDEVTLKITDGWDVTISVADTDADTTNELQTVSQVLSKGNDAGAGSIVNVGQVGIGTSTPEAGAALEINSTTGALLLSRMTTVQRDAITGIPGMVIYNTDESKFQGFFMEEAASVTQIDTGAGAMPRSIIDGFWVMHQSFTAPATTEITKVVLLTDNGSDVSGVLEILVGDGTGGASLHSQAVTYTGCGSGVCETEIELSAPVNVTSGAQYTIKLQATGSGFSTFTNNANPYAGGQVYHNATSIPGEDMYFRLFSNTEGWVDLH